MKKFKAQTHKAILSENLKEFFKNSNSIAATKRASEKKIMGNQMFKATGGKGIVFSNKCL